MQQILQGIHRTADVVAFIGHFRTFVDEDELEVVVLEVIYQLLVLFHFVSFGDIKCGVVS